MRPPRSVVVALAAVVLLLGALALDVPSAFVEGWRTHLLPIALPTATLLPLSLLQRYPWMRVSVIATSFLSAGLTAFAALVPAASPVTTVARGPAVAMLLGVAALLALPGAALLTRSARDWFANAPAGRDPA